MSTNQEFLNPREKAALKYGRITCMHNMNLNHAVSSIIFNYQHDVFYINFNANYENIIQIEQFPLCMLYFSVPNMGCNICPFNSLGCRGNCKREVNFRGCISRGVFVGTLFGLILIVLFLLICLTLIKMVMKNCRLLYVSFI